MAIRIFSIEEAMDLKDRIPRLVLIRSLEFQATLTFHYSAAWERTCLLEQNVAKQKPLFRELCYDSDSTSKMRLGF